MDILLILKIDNWIFEGILNGSHMPENKTALEIKIHRKGADQLAFPSEIDRKQF
jgi:hypothetical protein